MHAESAQRFPGIDRVVSIGSAFAAAAGEPPDNLILGQSDVRRVVSISHEGQGTDRAPVDQARFDDPGLIHPIGHFTRIEIIDRDTTRGGFESESDPIDTTPAVKTQDDARSGRGPAVKG
jgi:hypothetical protein